MKRNIFWLLAMLAAVSMVVTSCGPAPTPEQIEVPVEIEVTRVVEIAGETVIETETETVIVTATPEPEDPEEAERRKTVIFDIDGGRVVDPEMWNVLNINVRLDQGAHQAVIEPLFILNYQTGQIEPWLGLSFTGNEGMDVWTLVLRDGVKWSDGEDFDADDVVYTIQTMIDNGPDVRYGPDMADWVESVEKVNKTTVRFYLTRPNPRFQLDYFSVRIWGSLSIVPEHIFKDQDPVTFNFYDPAKGWPVYTGPYKVESVSDTEFVYVRDDNWWGAQLGWKRLPQPEKLVWVWAGPEETRAALMANGQLDSLMDVTLGALQAIQAQNPNVITWFDEMPYAWVPDPCSRTFEFNLSKEPWNNKNIRWAMNYAIDRDQIVAISYEGTTLKSRHFFPAYPPLDRYVDVAIESGVYDLDQLWTHDPELAKEMIEAEGYTLNSAGYYEKDGQELTMDISLHEAFIEKQRIAQVLVEQWQAIGVNATMRLEAGQTWSDNHDMGTFDVRMGWQTCDSVNEPWASMDRFNTRWLMPVGERASKNEWRWSGPQADAYSAIVDEIGVLPLGDPAIDDMFIEAMAIWFDELPVIPITQAKKIIPFDTTYWTGWPTYYDNQYIHPPTWWQHTHKIIHNLEPVPPQ
jgi:peptide/nickel transport system substrate-binding protein